LTLSVAKDVFEKRPNKLDYSSAKAERLVYMSFFKSLPGDAGPGNVFTRYPGIYRLWAEMRQALMNGPSPLSQAEHELLFAYAAGVARCKFVYVAHSAVACAWASRTACYANLYPAFRESK
jgi:hypothetical protein